MLLDPSPRGEKVFEIEVGIPSDGGERVEGGKR